MSFPERYALDLFICAYAHIIIIHHCGDYCKQFFHARGFFACVLDNLRKKEYYINRLDKSNAAGQKFRKGKEDKYEL